MKWTALAARVSVPICSVALIGLAVLAAYADHRHVATDAETGLTQQEVCGEGRTDEVEHDADFGDPLPGLSADELTRFGLGREAFEDVEGVADGLGPVFNDVSCASCHDSPQVGGGSDVLSTRIGTLRDEVFDPLERFGGPTIQTKGIGLVEGHEFVGEVVPKEATIVSRRRATPLFGFGLVDSVPDSTFFFIARMQQRFSPETAGRPNLVIDLQTGETAVGRFGWKAQAATVFDFCADAYKDEMGITVPGLFSSDDGRNVSEENLPQGDADALAFNPIASPNEEDTADISAFADFIRMLAPPPRGRITGSVRAGAGIFRRIGCSSCHLPTLRTGPSDVDALHDTVFHPFSDFLLHDMGSLGDEIEQGSARGSEMRTAPLWGLREQTALLHDGRASTIEEAILEHDGQGRAARNRYLDLRKSERKHLLDFLNSL